MLTPEIAGLARAVADRYAGTLADVLRLAVPQRHAATESAPRAGAAAITPGRPEPGPWARYPAGPAFLDAVAAGRPARAAWTALPGATWPEEIARAAATAASTGRGAVIVVPDARDLARVDAALAEIGAGHVTLTADLGPAERYRRWLAALRGEALIVAGTRAAMFAPVRALGLVVLWDDGDDLHAEPRAPYPNAREVLALRAHRAGAAALIGGFARTAELAQLVESGWARALEPDRATLRAAAPRVRPGRRRRGTGRDEAATTARLPSLALRTARAALARRTGPRPGAAARLPRRDRLRPLPRPGPVRPAAAVRCGWPARTRPRTAAGAARWPPAGAARAAATTGSARSSPARPAPPRNSAGPSPASRSAPPAATWCSRRSPTSPPW